MLSVSARFRHNRIDLHTISASTTPKTSRRSLTPDDSLPSQTCRSYCASTDSSPPRFAVPSVNRNSPPRTMKITPVNSEVVWVSSGPNRTGRPASPPAELKAMQEVITLAVFAVFSVTYLGEKLTVNHLVGFGFIALGAWFVFKGPISL